eukprot:CAMPEP_0185788944 /NCGR_PEP_ID=MMETSP1174-20130828/148592_1 /TAXON_ID=35687 /ORGANISM="Dictyocha speculum, Strain CCMP1381" /LENGTH=34 /DNA_ID= /DNA_START= /DNA_END= /DNA_ORIENTATION=
MASRIMYCKNFARRESIEDGCRRSLEFPGRQDPG